MDKPQISDIQKDRDKYIRQFGYIKLSDVESDVEKIRQLVYNCLSDLDDISQEDFDTYMKESGNDNIQDIAKAKPFKVRS